MKIFYKLITDYTKQSDLAIARKLGHDDNYRSYLSRLRKGQQVPTTAWIERLAAEYGLELVLIDKEGIIIECTDGSHDSVLSTAAS